jgi:ribosomal protein L31
MAKSTDITYYQDATAKCTNCGSIYTLGSTIQTLTIEICGNCHPFYTGKSVLVDTAGRIDKFKSRMEKVQTGTLSDLMVEEESPTEEKPKAAKKTKANSDSVDFTKIEGIGPKISGLLIENGYSSFDALAKANLEDLTKILEENSLASHKPDTWPQQAQLAAEEKWDDLKTLQDELNGGKVEA